MFQIVSLSRLLRCAVFCLVQRDMTERSCASYAIAMLEHDSPEPSRKRRNFSQLVQVAISLQECFLGSVFGKLKIAGDQIAVSDRHILKPPHDGFIGVSVTFARA